MKNTGKLEITARGEREIVMTRDFDAPRHLVFDALTRPELLKRARSLRGLVDAGLRGRSEGGRQLSLLT